MSSPVYVRRRRGDTYSLPISFAFGTGPIADCRTLVNVRDGISRTRTIKSNRRIALPSSGQLFSASLGDGIHLYTGTPGRQTSSAHRQWNQIESSTAAVVTSIALYNPSRSTTAPWLVLTPLTQPQTMLLLFLLPTLALAAPSSRRWLPGYDNSRTGPSNADCSRTEYHLDVSSMNTIFRNVDSNANATVLTSLFQTFTSSLTSTNFTDAYESAGKQQVNGTYAISGTICYPKGGKVEGAIQLLVHGIGFDSSYWDFALGGGDEYSYVSAAAEAGYTTFRFDR